MRFGNFIFVSENDENNENPDPFVEYKLREAERRELLKELLRELQLNRKFYGADAEIIIDSKVKFKK